MRDPADDDLIAARIWQSYRAVHGPVTPDKAAFARIIAATELPLHEDAARNCDRLYAVFDDCMSVAYRLTFTTEVNESHFRTAADALKKARSAVRDLRAALRALEVPGGHFAKFLGDQTARVSRELSEIDNFVEARRTFRASFTNEPATRGHTAFHHALLSILSGFYELAFSPRKVPARPAGPFERFLNACLDEMRTAIKSSRLSIDAKSNALKKWEQPPQETVRSRLKEPRATRTAILELRDQLRARSRNAIAAWEQAHDAQSGLIAHSSSSDQIGPSGFWDTASQRWRARGGE